jgi:L-serine dehydratase
MTDVNSQSRRPNGPGPISTFELFTIGLGPSSSHTVGPMRAAKVVAADSRIRRITNLDVRLAGSLALTGTGHGTERAVLAGLLGWDPETADPDAVQSLDPRADTAMVGQRYVAYRLLRTAQPPPGHPNAISFSGYVDGSVEFSRTFRSVGGGFTTEDGVDSSQNPIRNWPAPFESAAELVLWAESLGGIARVVRKNEGSLVPPEFIARHLDAILQAMESCIESGLNAEGLLPGRLGVRRRAKGLAESLRNRSRDPSALLEWLSTWAIAVNEENAAGRRVVTAPTNGAAGVFPAVLRYARVFEGIDEHHLREMVLTGAAIGSIVKQHASISGAEMGCQGEVGTAAAMAAAAFAEACGGTPKQAINAAEIALEHHLGMTCDPVAGLVQIPCIERNALGAVKAITAARLALLGDGRHRVSFDQVVDAMCRTGTAMHADYKETARGGLAVSVIQC